MNTYRLHIDHCTDDDCPHHRVGVMSLSSGNFAVELTDPDYNLIKRTVLGDQTDADALASLMIHRVFAMFGEVEMLCLLCGTYRPREISIDTDSGHVCGYCLQAVRN